MAKQFSLTVQINGGSNVQHDVIIKDTEDLFESAFYFRVSKAFGMADGDAFKVVAHSGPTTVSNPMQWDTIPDNVIAVVSRTGQISLAFINGG